MRTLTKRSLPLACPITAGKRVSRAGLILSTLLLGIIACESPIIEPPVEPPDGLYPSIAFVHGFVVDELGVPVDSAKVRVEFAGEGNECWQPADGKNEWFFGLIHTDSMGYYQLMMKFRPLYPNFPACLAVSFVAPPSSGLDSMLVDSVLAIFRHELRTPPVDTVRVDAVLQPVP